MMEFLTEDVAKKVIHTEPNDQPEFLVGIIGAVLMLGGLLFFLIKFIGFLLKVGFF